MLVDEAKFGHWRVLVLFDAIKMWIDRAAWPDTHADFLMTVVVKVLETDNDRQVGSIPRVVEVCS